MLAGLQEIDAVNSSRKYDFETGISASDCKFDARFAEFSMPKVMIGPNHLSLQGEFRTVLDQAGFELVFPKTPVQMTLPEVLRDMEGVTASLAGSEPYTRQVF